MGVIFTILAILAILLTVGGVATYLHLSPKRSEEAGADATAEPAWTPEEPSQEETPPSPPAPTPSSAPLSATQHLVVVSEHLHIEGAPMPIGTVLSRNAQGVWTYNNRDLSAPSVETMVRNGYLTPISFVDQRMRDALARITNITQVSLATSMRAVQEDFSTIARDFSRAFATPAIPAIRATRPTTPQTPAPKPTPAPVPATPKSAIDRLLEDDLLPDDDVGVKPKV